MEKKTKEIVLTIGIITVVLILTMIFTLYYYITYIPPGTKYAPTIEFYEYEDSRALSVVNVSSNDLNWSDINITISTGNYSDIYLYPALTSSQRYSYGNGSSCPSRWGIIRVNNSMVFLGKVTARIIWKPTNTIIGEWDFT